MTYFTYLTCLSSRDSFDKKNVETEIFHKYFTLLFVLDNFLKCISCHFIKNGKKWRDFGSFSVFFSRIFLIENSKYSLFYNRFETVVVWYQVNWKESKELLPLMEIVIVSCQLFNPSVVLIGLHMKIHAVIDVLWRKIKVKHINWSISTHTESELM